MVFVDKTLDDMLKEIGFSNPVTLRSYWNPREKLSPNGTYIFKRKVDAGDIDDVGRLWENMQNDFCYFFDRNKKVMGHAYYRPTELMVNALEWGGGINEIVYYVTPKGIVFEMVQNREWDYKTIVNKFNRGLYPSRRKKNEDTWHGGGCGLWAAKDNKEAEISYQGRSTLILYIREVVENKIKSFGEES